MSTKHNDAIEGGPQGPSGDVENGVEAIRRIAMHLHEKAIGSRGELSPLAQEQLDLRNVDERRDYLERLIQEVVPSRANMGLWSEWLQGGKSPFGNGEVRKVGTAKEGPSQTANRTSGRVEVQRKKVARLRTELESEESHLEYLKSHDKAALQWLVTNHLIEIMSGIFAMGPAWTIMRALSGHLSDEEAHLRTLLYEGEEKHEEVKAERALYMDEARKMMENLDRWSGDPEFEQSLRKAVLGVVDIYAAMGDEAIANGRRRRSETTARETINPRGMESARDVIFGFAGSN